MTHTDAMVITAFVVYVITSQWIFSIYRKKLDNSLKRLFELEIEKAELEMEKERSMAYRYSVYVNGVFKMASQDYAEVTPLSKFGKNVLLFRDGEKYKWIGSGVLAFEEEHEICSSDCNNVHDVSAAEISKDNKEE